MKDDLKFKKGIDQQITKTRLPRAVRQPLFLFFTVFDFINFILGCISFFKNEAIFHILKMRSPSV